MRSEHASHDSVAVARCPSGERCGDCQWQVEQGSSAVCNPSFVRPPLLSLSRLWTGQQAYDTTKYEHLAKAIVQDSRTGPIMVQSQESFMFTVGKLGEQRRGIALRGRN